MNCSFKANEDLVEDMKVVSARRGQSMAEFIRCAVETELERDATQSVTD